jgi:hypothetical protein
LTFLEGELSPDLREISNIFREEPLAGIAGLFNIELLGGVGYGGLWVCGKKRQSSTEDQP